MQTSTASKPRGLKSQFYKEKVCKDSFSTDFFFIELLQIVIVMVIQCTGNMEKGRCIGCINEEGPVLQYRRCFSVCGADTVPVRRPFSTDAQCFGHGHHRQVYVAVFPECPGIQFLSVHIEVVDLHHVPRVAVGGIDGLLYVVIGYIGGHAEGASFCFTAATSRGSLP